MRGQGHDRGRLIPGPDRNSARANMNLSARGAAATGRLSPTPAWHGAPVTASLATVHVAAVAGTTVVIDRNSARGNMRPSVLAATDSCKPSRTAAKLALPDGVSSTAAHAEFHVQTPYLRRLDGSIEHAALETARRMA